MGDEGGSGVVDQDIEGAGVPDFVKHLLHRIRIANVAAVYLDGGYPRFGQAGCGRIEHVTAAPAQHQRCAQTGKAFGHDGAESGAAAGDENAFSGQQVSAKHDQSVASITPRR